MRDNPGADMPVRQTLIFDGDCGFCTVCAHWVERKLGPESDVIAWQEIADLGSFGLTVPKVMRAAYWIDAHGKPFGASRAVARALVAVGGGWAIVGYAIDAPGVRILSEVGYAIVRKYRHLLPGSTGACRLG